MKKFAKILPYLIILFCVAFITLTLLKVDEQRCPSRAERSDRRP